MHRTANLPGVFEVVQLLLGSLQGDVLKGLFCTLFAQLRAEILILHSNAADLLLMAGGQLHIRRELPGNEDLALPGHDFLALRGAYLLPLL